MECDGVFKILYSGVPWKWVFNGIREPVGCLVSQRCLWLVFVCNYFHLLLRTGVAFTTCDSVNLFTLRRQLLVICPSTHLIDYDTHHVIISRVYWYLFLGAPVEIILDCRWQIPFKLCCTDFPFNSHMPKPFC